MATVSGALFAAVAITSVRAARRRLSYETWYGIHLYAYLAIALGFLHQLFVGTDFVSDPVAVAYWVALYVVTVALILVFRIGQPIAFSVRHRLRVSQRRHRKARASSPSTSPDATWTSSPSGPASTSCGGSSPATAGGAATRSPSRRPRTGAGCASRSRTWATGPGRSQALTIGTRVFIEGPYGVLTGARRTRPKVLLIAGGIGITPLRALLEALPAKPGDLTLLYRVRDARRRRLPRPNWRRWPARAAPGSTTWWAGATRLAIRSMRPRSSGSSRMSQDHDVYLCGPAPMMQRVEATLRDLGVARRQIHAERFAY